MNAAASTKRIKLHGGSACPLPEEIVEDILSRLPAKSLRRFQCVSRSFHAVIASRAFQDVHFQRNSGKRRLFIRPDGRFQEPFYAWHPAGGPVERIMSARNLPQGSIFPVSKSCRGLVLLISLDYQTHYVWNPSTGDILALPSRIPLRATWHASTLGPLVSYGLGYCSATQRHKIVRMYCVHENGGPTTSTICEVFTLNESAYWVPVATKPPAPQYDPTKIWLQGAVFCNGNLHFLQADGEITVFNVTDETFGMLKLPPELQCCSSIFELTELGGNLCAYIVEKKWNRDYSAHHPFVVWLLRDYGAAGIWEKLCCFDWGAMPEAKRAALKSSWIAPLDMYYDGGDNKKIMFGTGSCNVFVVDTNIGAPEILFSPEDTVIGECRDNRFPTMGLFEESLASVGNVSESTTFMSPWMQAWSEVLSRLPARAVRRLKQVCRGWRAMIMSEHFVAAHLYRANLNKSPQMMFINGVPYGFEPVNSFVNTPYVAPLIRADSRIVCSKPCHGLNAGSFGNCDFVCNPVTGYFKALPLGSTSDWKTLPMYEFLDTVSSECRFIGDAMFAGRLGLGYEQESSRHVLVRFAYKERNLTTRDYKMVCHMRSVEGMVWDEVDPPPRPIANMPLAYVNGKLYWMVDTELRQRSPGHEIVGLDVSTRRFEVLEGPPCGHEYSEHMSIIELEGVVCVACSHQSVGIIKIWAMEDTGMWFVKLDIELERFSPEYLPETTTPIAVDAEDGRILLSTGRALGYYDPKTAELETIYRLGKNTDGMKFVPVLFQESLVRPRDSIY